MPDTTTFRLSKGATDVATLLVTNGWFASDIDAARFAMAYVLKNNFDSFNPATYIPADSGGNTYNTGSLDGDGQLSTLLRALYPGCATPYTYARNLMNYGLLALGAKIEAEGLSSISAFM